MSVDANSEAGPGPFRDPSPDGRTFDGVLTMLPMRTDNPGMDKQDLIAGMMVPIALLVIALFVLLSLLYKSPLAHG